MAEPNPASSGAYAQELRREQQEGCRCHTVATGSPDRPRGQCEVDDGRQMRGNLGGGSLRTYFMGGQRREAFNGGFHGLGVDRRDDRAADAGLQDHRRGLERATHLADEEHVGRELDPLILLRSRKWHGAFRRYPRKPVGAALGNN